jgi:hypothetical protein
MTKQLAMAVIISCMAATVFAQPSHTTMSNKDTSPTFITPAGEIIG